MKLLKHIRAIGRNPDGETLLEVIIALAVLMITLGYSGSVIASSISQLASSHNRVIATSLAKEGLEAVRNIIGSNLLRLHEDAANCWNAGFYPLDDPDKAGRPVMATDDCEGIKIEEGIFRLFLNREENFFSLYYATGTSSLSAIHGDFNFSLNLVDVAGDTPIFLDCFAVDNPSICTNARFYRAIQIQYGNLDAASGDMIPDHMLVTSYVSWGTGQNDSVTMSTILTSFMQ